MGLGEGSGPQVCSSKESLPGLKNKVNIGPELWRILVSLLQGRLCCLNWLNERWTSLWNTLLPQDETSVQRALSKTWKPENGGLAWARPRWFDSLGPACSELFVGVVTFSLRLAYVWHTAQVGRGGWGKIQLEIASKHWRFSRFSREVWQLWMAKLALVILQESNRPLLNGRGGGGLENTKIASTRPDDWFIWMWGKRWGWLMHWSWEQVWVGCRRLMTPSCKLGWSLTLLGSRQCWSLVTSHLFHCAHCEIFLTQCSAK